LRILLVEDSDDNRFLILSYLKKTPHQVDSAENGAVAFDKFKESAYDLVFMDMEMPIMDGYTTTREIRQWEKENQRQPAPIIALTAHALQEYVHKSLDAGCDAHLSKPIKKAKFIETVNTWAEKIVAA